MAGVLGMDTDDERIRDAFDLARAAGLDVAFSEAPDDASVHPNTVDIEMTCADGSGCQVRGESLGGGRIRISRVNGVGVDITGAYATLFVGHRDAPGLLARAHARARRGSGEHRLLPHLPHRAGRPGLLRL